GRPQQASRHPAAAVEIDLDGIERRVVALPVPEARYERVAGTKDKVLYTTYPVVGVRERDFEEPPVDRPLHACTLATGATEELDAGVTDFRLSPDHATLVYRSGWRLRALPAGEKPNPDKDPGRASGWVDLDRIKVSVRPQAEWRQMFLEAWRLQRENFWNAA